MNEVGQIKHASTLANERGREEEIVKKDRETGKQAGRKFKEVIKHLIA